MTVVPFVVDGPSKTIVETREEFEAEGGLDGSVILIKNLDRNQVDTSQIIERKSSNASYDLRVGGEYRDHRDLGKTDLPDNGTLYLPPGAAIIIETYEEVQFPRSRFGHIVPKVKLLMEGVSNTSSKIDPGFDGRLLITVFNLGTKRISLKKGQEFCTLYILNVQKEGLISREKDRPRMPGLRRENSFRRITTYIESNQALLSIINLLATIVLTSITAALLLSQFQQSRVDSVEGEQPNNQAIEP